MHIPVFKKSLFIVLSLLLTACASLPEVVDRPVSYTHARTGDSRIAGSKLLANSTGKPGESGFILLRDGLDAFVARAQLAANAEHGIDVQYYIYQDDLTASLLTAQLLKAADRGVRIRVLVDDLEPNDGDYGLVELDLHNKIEVRVFNPFVREVSRWSQFITRLGIVKRRMHNKSFTVDNQITIVGGRNIGDEYFDAHPNMAFSDLDVMATGPVVQQVADSFDEYWNSEVVYPIASLIKRRPGREKVAQKRHRFEQSLEAYRDSEYLAALRNSEFSDQLMLGTVQFNWGRATVVSDSPEKAMYGRERGDLLLSTQIGPWLENPKRELIIISPYFVPGKWGTRALVGLAQSGVRVRVLTNSLSSTDVAVVHGGYARYRKELLMAGVELYELDDVLNRKQRKAKRGSEKGFTKSSLHTKSFIADRALVLIGSLNLDPRSLFENTEIGVVLESREIAEEMAAWFDREIRENAYTLTLEKVRQAGATRPKKLVKWRYAIRWHKANEPQVIYRTEPNAGLWRRLGAGLLSILPIESQL